MVIEGTERRKSLVALVTGILDMVNAFFLVSNFAIISFEKLGTINIAALIGFVTNMVDEKV